MSRAADEVRGVVAKNLAAARLASGMTQDELAQSASVSRATVVQLENGQGDPKVSTLADLAAALGTSPVMLLMGRGDMSAIVEVLHHPEQVTNVELFVDEASAVAAQGSPRPAKRAAEVGKTVVAAGGLVAAASMGSAIGTMIAPGIGTAVGAALGAAWSHWSLKDKGRKP